MLRKIDSADGMPGLVDSLSFQEARLFDAHEAHGISGVPGTVVAQCDGALARATVDGAVWIGHVRKLAPKSLKLPAAKLFAAEAAHLPHRPGCGYAPIRYREHVEVAELAFSFYNGAMATGACEALLEAYRAALARPTRVLLLTVAGIIGRTAFILQKSRRPTAPRISPGATSMRSTILPARSSRPPTA
ncbi:hypothetical protein ABIC08_008359 [Bradyrhizobium sp. RT9b]|uniref:hypothetical protein n=1 Tax=Bradyrhizobium sp. RT9b TaxID=3156385 RepID=UPI0033997207